MSESEDDEPITWGTTPDDGTATWAFEQMVANTYKDWTGRTPARRKVAVLERYLRMSLKIAHQYEMKLNIARAQLQRAGIDDDELN